MTLQKEIQYFDNRYIIEGCLSQATHRATWIAFDQVLNRRVIVKGAVGETCTPDLLLEYKRLQTLCHPALPEAFDVGQAEQAPPPLVGQNFCYFTQEYIQGPSLAVMKGRLSVQDAQQCLAEILQLMGWLHRFSVIRLDLKPAHIIRSNGRWYLIDLDQATQDQPLARGQPHGTLPYLAPEVLKGEPASKRADLYSLGVVLFETLEGRLPYETQGSHVSKGVSGKDSPNNNLEGTALTITSSLDPSSMDCLRALLTQDCDLRLQSCESALEIIHIDRGPEYSDWFQAPTFTEKHTLRALESVKAGQVVALTGPRGCGHSRILKAAKLHFSLKGYRTLWLKKPMTGETRTLSGNRALKQLSRFFTPDERVRQPGSLEASILTALHSLTPGHKTCLLFEQLDEEDRASSDCIQGLVPYLAEAGCVLLLARCDGPEKWLPVPNKNHRIMPLTKDHIRRLGELYLGPGAFTADELQHIYESSQGLSRYIYQAIDLRLKDQSLDLCTWYPQEGQGPRSSFTNDLDKDCAKALSRLAVYSLPALAQWIGAESETLQKLLKLDLIRGEGEQEKSFRYQVHPEDLRQTLLASMEGLEFQKNHSLAADSLIQASLLGQPQLTTAIAHHLYEAKRFAEAGPYLAQSVEQMATQKQWLNATLPLISLIEIQNSPCPALHLRLGEVLAKRSLTQQALEAFRIAESHKYLLDTHLQIRLAQNLGECLALCGQDEHAVALLEEALGTKGSRLDCTADIRLRHLLTWSYLNLGQLPRAIKALEACDTTPPLEGKPLVEHIHLQARLSLTKGDDPEQTIRRLRMALNLSESMDYAKGMVGIGNLLALALKRQGHLEESKTALNRAIDGCQALVDSRREASCVLNRGILLRTMDKNDEALQDFERATRLYHRFGNHNLALDCKLNGAELLIELGQLQRAKSYLLPLEEAQTHRLRLWSELLIHRLNIRLKAQPVKDSTLKMLELQLRDLGQHALANEARADRMELALGNNDPALALRHFTGLTSEEKNKADAVATRRLHRLASKAHLCLAGGQAPTQEVIDKVPSKGETSVNNRQWLIHLQRLVSVADEPAALAATLAKIAGDLVGGRGLVLLFDGLNPEVIRGYRIEADEENRISHSLLSRVRASKKTYACADTQLDPDLSSLQSIRKSNVRSIVCSPVLFNKKCLGAIYVDHPQAGMAAQEAAVEAIDHIARLAAGLLNRLQTPTLRAASTQFEGLIGSSESMDRLRGQLSALALAESPDLVVLLLGETGTGKSMVARTLHQQGQRKHKPFLAVNCAAIPENLFESEMFGHARGAFTGASQDQEGWLAQAQGGVLFLDEIGEMPLSQQAKLLTALSSRSYSPVGEKTPRPLDIHLYLATNRELHADVQSGRFRDDLLRRIWSNVVEIPSLRQRGADDITLIAQHLITRCLPPGAIPPDPRKIFSSRAFEYLLNHSWPWNIGEMENLFRNESLRAIIREGTQRVNLEQLEQALGTSGPQINAQSHGGPPSNLSLAELESWFRRLKMAYVEEAIESAGGNVAEAARRLQCARPTLHYIRRGGRRKF